MNSKILGIQIWRKKMRKYYHAIYIVLTYFASFTGFEDDIFEVFSYLPNEGSKTGGKMDQFGKN